MVTEYYPFNFVDEATDFVARLKFSFCELNYVVFHSSNPGRILQRIAGPLTSGQNINICIYKQVK